MSNYRCNYKGCNSDLDIEQKVIQNKTGKVGFKLRCKKNWRHKFFVVESVGSLIRVACSRFEKPPIKI